MHASLFSVTAGLLTAAGLALWPTDARADDWWNHRHHHFRRYDHARFHDDLEHREFHRHLRHRDAHRFPMTWWQHERLHDRLDHERFHDYLEHRDYHRHFNRWRGGYAPGWYGGYYSYPYNHFYTPGFGYQGRRFSFWINP